MGKVEELPFKVPNFATVHAAGAAELAMIGHPSAYNQVLNQATDIYCSRTFLKGVTTPHVSIPDITINSYNFIECYDVNFRFVYNHCLDIIKQMLDSGMYVWFDGVDDFYLPEKSWYGTRHMNHTGIICGYDDNDGTFSIAAHDINWVYRLIRIPQQCWLNGLKSSLDSKYYGKLTAYKVKDNTVVTINEKTVLKRLKQYMDSNFEKYPPDNDGAVQGVVVHDYLAMYVDKLKDGSIPSEKMDWRSLRPIWEHKRCMLERITAIEIRNGWGNDLSERYAYVVEKANCIRMMYAMYHKNYNKKLLDKIRDGLIDLSNRDKELVGEFIKRLEELNL